MGFEIDQNGFYGEFGGAYIPEMLYPNIKELEENYLKITTSEQFRKEFGKKLKLGTKILENGKP